MPCRYRRDFFLKVYSIYCGMRRRTEFWNGTENAGIGQTLYGMFGGRNLRGKIKVSRWIQGVISMGRHGLKGVKGIWYV